jgi:hypothetical protein
MGEVYRARDTKLNRDVALKGPRHTVVEEDAHQRPDTARRDVGQRTRARLWRNQELSNASSTVMPFQVFEDDRRSDSEAKTVWEARRVQTAKVVFSRLD